MRSTTTPSQSPRVLAPSRRGRARPTGSSRRRPGPVLDPLDRALVEQHQSLAYRLAWYYARNRARDVPADELIAEALYGLTYAAGLFCESRRVPFPAYATLVIRHRLTHAVRTWRRAAREVPYPAAPLSGDEPWEAPDYRPEPDLGVGAREMCDRIRRLLPAQWYAILRLHHAEGRTFQEIANHFGLSRQRIRQLFAKATTRVRRHFPDWAEPTPADEREGPVP